MNKTRHATTNYKMLLPLLGDMLHTARNHKRYTSEAFMPLVIEKLGYKDYKDRPVFSMTHYGEQNGDAMCDPDMTFSVNEADGTIEPLTYQNDYMGMYQEVYRRNDAGQLMYSRQLRTDLDAFLWQWLKNIGEQMPSYHLQAD